MASSARIDELQKKFDENPKRYFAPLANEFRKAGDLEQAVALCRAFLPQQPAHMSGHIVFGQALFESKQHEEARTVFETALSLDPENLIALRYLGDIARETGDIAAAAGWYRRVLDADPRNEEIAAIVAALPAVENPAPAVAEAPPADLEIALPEAPAATTAAPSSPAAVPSPGAATGADDQGPLSMRESLEVPAIPDPAAAVPELEQSHELELGDLAPPAAPTDDVAFTGTGPANEMGFEVMEFVPPDRGDAAERPSGFQEDVPESADGSTPAAFVTETMAELYLQQGFHQEALTVYRQLLAQNPNDVGLRERVEQLASGARSSVGAAAVSDEVIESAQRRRTAGSVRTIRTFLASLAARRVVRNPEEGADDGPRQMEAPSWTPESGDVADAAMEAAAPEAAPHVERQPTPAWTRSEEPPASEQEEGEERETATELPWLEPPPDESTDESWAAPAVDDSSESPDESGSHRSLEPAATADSRAGHESADSARSDAPRPERLSGEMGSVNTLFTGAPVTSDDASAAEVLAGAFLAPEPEETPAERSAAALGRPARAAANELSLDNVFREPGQRTSSEQRRSAFSFDQFFSEGGGAERGQAEGESDESSPDDIAQFNAWLEGLKKK